MTFDWQQTATATRMLGMTLAIALVGGTITTILGVPAPWLSGPALAVAIMSIWGFKLGVPGPVRQAALVFLGATMGTSVTPESLALMAHWPLSLIGLAVCVFAIMSSIAFYLERVHGYDRATARLSGVPGALPFVLAMAAESTGDVRRITIIQMMRLAILLICLPTLLTALGQRGPGTTTGPAVSVVPLQLIVVFGVGLIGAKLFEALRAPAGLLFGAMVAVAILYGSGAVSSALPPWLLLPGYIVIGAMVGSNFSGTDTALLRDTALAGVGSVVVGGLVALACAVPVAWTLGLPPAQLWLAYAPGGVETMAIMALALGLDPAFVGGHHVARFMGLGLLVPLWLRDHLRRRVS